MDTRRRRPLSRCVFQDGPHLRHRLKALPWIGGQASLHDAGKRRRHCLARAEHISLTGHADASQQFVEDDAEAEDVGGNVECLPRSLFW